VDEHGRCHGFFPVSETDVGRFGCLLERDQEVETDSGEHLAVGRVYSRINTGPPGTSNYVIVDLYDPDEERPD
jgi:hypothetical protein